ncbi:2-polyprenyl-6-methoxyphenol hydroxylase-like FAD-dependent oxidoreductase [Modicisalibacter xianhensis]|uniref:2-polyprenyl-6-methoxyphenol hydroxylase-like FAD-dependent oxidoreductase n=1 Tax=Modicisalibacter xianhensis TaxID=442341 RepID=A0A4R8G1E1_9GAMM|nr:NAD(P)/FAD-dependent oxidoreductase [Halomonas xianhensis]TDX29812.1 2-polyprenyl-6-methoxyphenol hydroxylase-like FAD-dependent oxidoreductase [Halomonas xianhensis]
MLPEDVDVLIVGAGPTGLALAIGLAQQGIRHAIVERRRHIAATSRAVVIHAYTLEHLDALGVSEQLIQRGLAVSCLAMHARGTTLVTASFSALPTRYPYALMLSQAETEVILEARLESLGGKVLRGYNATDLMQAETYASVTLADEKEVSSSIKARYVVGADGMHSLVRQAARIPFQGGDYEEAFILADVAMDWELPRQEINLFFAPEGVMVVLPLPGDRFRIVAACHGASAAPSAGEMQAILDRRGPAGGLARIRTLIWSSHFHIHHRLAECFHQGRVVLAGDAAHVHSPAGGQGMNLGLVDACLLAERLTEAIVDDGGSSALDDYQARRKPVAEHVIQTTDRMTRLATINSYPLRLARNVSLRTLGKIQTFRRSLVMNLSGLDQRK